MNKLDIDVKKRDLSQKEMSEMLEKKLKIAKKIKKKLKKKDVIFY